MSLNHFRSRLGSRRDAAITAILGAALATVLLGVTRVDRDAKNAHSEPLFDGKTLAGWATRDGKPVTKGWTVEDACIVRATHGGGDIYTENSYEDFDLAFEWKVTAGVNSGVKYRVRQYDDGQRLGPEYQIIDESTDKPKPGSETGSLYALYETSPDRVLNPPGEWNHARIVARGARLEHWLNGVKLLDADTASDDWAARLGKSKFATRPGFATGAGPIMLTDHAPALADLGKPDKVWFRNLTIRRVE